MGFGFGLLILWLWAEQKQHFAFKSDIRLWKITFVDAASDVYVVLSCQVFVGLDLVFNVILLFLLLAMQHGSGLKQNSKSILQPPLSSHQQIVLTFALLWLVKASRCVSAVSASSK